MNIKYSRRIIQPCPECHHLSVYFFEDLIMCMLCGWDHSRSNPQLTKETT